MILVKAPEDISVPSRPDLFQIIFPTISAPDPVNFFLSLVLINNDFL